MSRRFRTLVAFASAVLSLPHLLPPRAAYFLYERAWLAVSRIIQGPLEFASYSLLSTVSLLTPLSMFICISALSILAAFLVHHIAHAGGELADILPSLLLLYALFGVLSIYAGGVLVSPPASCITDSLQAPTQKVMWFDELGWDPGVHYFLLEIDPTTGRWSQTGYARLDMSIDDPCSSIEKAFPP
jgi:hypothetical protein